LQSLVKNTQGILEIKVMRGKNLKEVDHIDCKIIAFKVKKRALFAPCKIRVSKL
jgi:hypothetical protein